MNKLVTLPLLLLPLFAPKANAQTQSPPLSFEQLGDSLTLYSHRMDSLEEKYNQAVIEDSLGQKALDKASETYEKLIEKAGRHVSKREKKRIQNYWNAILIPAMKEARDRAQIKLDALIAYIEVLQKVMQLSEEQEKLIKELEEKEKQIKKQKDDIEERIRQEKSGIFLYEESDC